MSETTVVSKLPVVLRPSYADAKLERIGLCPKICHFLNILNILSWGYWGFRFQTNAYIFRIGQLLFALFGFANRGKSRFTESSLFHPFPIIHFINFSINFSDLISSSGHPICAASVPPGKRQAVWSVSWRRVICLLANKQLQAHNFWIQLICNY